MAEIDLAGLVIGLIHREIHDPGKGKAVFVGQPQLIADLNPRLARHGLKRLWLTAKEKRGIALAKPELQADGLGALRPDILGQRPGGFHAVLAFSPENIAHPRQALFLGKGVHPVAEFTAAATLGRNGPDFVAHMLQQVGKNRKSRAAEMLRDILHLDRVAQIRLVGAIPKCGVTVRDLRPVLIHLAALAELFKNALNHRLNGVKHILLLNERHLHIKLIEIRGRAVGARVFIPKTRGDLEILVKARHHDQLLEELRRLRQRIEFTGMQTRRHQKIARALRGRRGNDRGLIFAEIHAPHAAADRGHNIRAQLHVVLHHLAAQIKIAIAQAGLFGVFLIAKHDQRQFLGLAQNLHVANENFHLAGGDLGVDQLLIARLHLAIDPDTPFAAQFFHLGKNRAVGVTQDLRHAKMIAQINEQDAAMIAHPVHPAGKPDRLAHVGFVQIGASVAAIGVHGIILQAHEGNRLGSRRYTLKGGQSQGLPTGENPPKGGKSVYRW